MARDPKVPDGMAEVMLLVDHIFLPAKLDSADWRDPNSETGRTTQRYEGVVIENGRERRARLTMRSDLAEFLVDRRQAEII